MYRIADNDARTITRDGDRLYSQRTRGERFEIYPIGADLFYFPANSATLRFERSNGRVIAATVIPRLGPAGDAARRVN